MMYLNVLMEASKMKVIDSCAGLEGGIEKIGHGKGCPLMIKAGQRV